MSEGTPPPIFCHGCGARIEDRGTRGDGSTRWAQRIASDAWAFTCSAEVYGDPPRVIVARYHWRQGEAPHYYRAP